MEMLYPAHVTSSIVLGARWTGLCTVCVMLLFSLLSISQRKQVLVEGVLVDVPPTRAEKFEELVIDSTDCTNATRISVTQNTCSYKTWSHDINVTNPNVYWRLLVDDVHGVLYCSIPKVGCTSFKTFIVNNSAPSVSGRKRLPVHQVKFMNSLGLKYLNQYDLHEIFYRLRHYHKFIVVRHPFDRLVSAYKEKFQEGKFYPKLYSKALARIFGSKLRYDKDKIARLKLHQFLELILRYYAKGFNDRHWKSYYELCHPCDIQYDSIIKLETLGADVRPMYQRYGVQQETTAFPEKNTDRSVARDKMAAITRMFSKLDPQLVEGLHKIYIKDFELFGYTWDQETGAQCQYDLPGGQTCC